MNEFIKKELDDVVKKAKEDEIILTAKDELLFTLGFKYGIVTAGGALANFDTKVGEIK